MFDTESDLRSVKLYHNVSMRRCLRQSCSHVDQVSHRPLLFSTRRKSSYTPAPLALCLQADTELPAIVDSAGLQVFLERLSDFDVAMNRVVVESGVLAGE